ncbi:LysE family translocator [Novosphingobium aquiterrae]|uniref:LysE family translocator n=1 Tax=Novosphingobium aquiterrae TaxID=624388 RepID=A0ABV6PK82_9SPHN
MIDMSHLAAFLVAATLLTITPGVDTAMVLRAATVEGRRAGLLAALGINLGCLIWGGAVALGLGTVLQASALAFAIIKLAGAAYLVWLGIGLLLRPRSALAQPDAALPGPRGSAFRRGLLTNLLNPKIGVFYISFLPQFVPAGAPVAATTFFLAVLHDVLGLVWFAILIGATVPLNRLLRQPRTLRWLDRLTGAVFVGFGLRLAMSSAR